MKNFHETRPAGTPHEPPDSLVPLFVAVLTIGAICIALWLR